MATGLTTTEPRGLTLHSVDDAMRFGKMLADSEFAPKDFRGKPASCVLAVQHGAELGLGPMQSIQSIAVINGRPSIWGDAALALVAASPVCEHVYEAIEGEGDAMVAVCEAKRRGYPRATSVRFGVADAKRAGLWGKSGPWTQYPRRMLQLRARGFALRDAFPDVLKGLVTAEEAGDYAVREADPVAEAVTAAPSAPTRLEGKGSPERLSQALALVRQASEIDQLDRIVAKANGLHGEGVFTKSQVDEVLAAANAREDELLAATDTGVGHHDAEEAAHG